MKVDAKKFEEDWKNNPMREPRLEKVTINFALGKSGVELEKARRLAEALTDQKPADSRAKKSVRGFGIRQNEAIGTHVTLRKEKAKEFLVKAFYALDDIVLFKNFDQNGNFSATVHDHLNLPKVKYDPKIGVFGFTVTANLERRGYRIKRRRLLRKKIPQKHKITKEEAIVWFQKHFQQIKVQEKREEDFY